MGLMPSVAGKSHYSVDFVDTVAADGTQNTEFHSDIAAPAGDIAKIDPGATYKWQDGNGEFAVSGKGAIDSTAQANMATEIGKQQIDALNVVLNALAPVLGQKLQSDDNQAQMKADTEDEKIRAAIALIESEMRKRETQK
jgi:hypothetical protein